MEAKLKAIGIRLSKSNWPYVTPADFMKAGITREDFSRFFKPATLHESQIGPSSMRKKGIIFKTGASTRVMKLVQ